MSDKQFKDDASGALAIAQSDRIAELKRQLKAAGNTLVELEQENERLREQRSLLVKIQSDSVNVAIANARKAERARVAPLVAAASEWARHTVNTIHKNGERTLHVENHELHYVAEVDLFDALAEFERGEKE